ncbi:Protein hgh1 [Ceratocystis pirilliformis]|uniref:Protein HGH1 homolog n=1 Tax=Ceratocystis pirilliformis TaxID=259994 RepID=A0ABR3YFU7_9PEZI
MPTELEELVGFISHPNPQIRQVAVENLVPFSLSQPEIFKANEYQSLKFLKILTRDKPAISEHAVTILVNLSGEEEVLKNLATDEAFVNSVLQRMVMAGEPNADSLSMLLANLTKWDGMKSILTKKQPQVDKLSASDLVLNQLMDAFVKGSSSEFNKKANYDYLSYVFADLSKHEGIRKFFLTKQDYDGEYPLNKMKVFTEHSSEIRRKGVASTIKNAAFEVNAHPLFIDEDEINLLPYVLLPITGNEEYDAEDMMEMIPDLQLLPPDKSRDSDPTIIQTHVETLMLLTTTRSIRGHLRAINVYATIRETHARVDNVDVQEACDRLVQVLKRDDPDEDIEGKETKVVEIEEDDEEAMTEV